MNSSQSELETESLSAKPVEAADASTMEGVESELGWSLHTVYAAFARLASPEVADIPGGPRGYHVLLAVVTEPARSQLELGRRLTIDKNAITAAIDGLEAGGYVQRRQDPADRRVRRIEATEAGVALLTAAQTRVHAAEARLFSRLSASEEATLRRLLAEAAFGLDPDSDCVPVAQIPAHGARS